MKFNIKLILSVKILLLLCLSIFVTSGFVYLNKKDETKARKIMDINDNEIITNPMVDWKVNYEKTIEFIKKHEGFAQGKPYICPGGYNTIGYGHLIQERDSFEELTEKQADSLLRADFNKALRLVDENVNISGSRKLAIAHFIFARGIGTFLQSGLKDRIDRDEPIDDLLMGYCYYTNIEGISIKSEHALTIRKWELYLYKLKSGSLV